MKGQDTKAISEVLKRNLSLASQEKVMDSKFSVWSDWIILLVALVITAGVGAFYRQTIHPARVQHSPVQLPKMFSSTPTMDSGIVAAVPLPLPRVVTTGEATFTPPRDAPAPELSQQRSLVVAVEPTAHIETPPGVAEIPQGKAKAEAPQPETAPVVAAHSAKKLRAGVVAKNAMVVKGKVFHLHHLLAVWQSRRVLSFANRAIQTIFGGPL
jgi:hypothetical protein